jgi:hypothetical protein
MSYHKADRPVWFLWQQGRLDAGGHLLITIFLKLEVGK